jgi:hypothetical protein
MRHLVFDNDMIGKSICQLGVSLTQLVMGYTLKDVACVFVHDEVGLLAGNVDQIVVPVFEE